MYTAPSSRRISHQTSSATPDSVSPGASPLVLPHNLDLSAEEASVVGAAIVAADRRGRRVNSTTGLLKTLSYSRSVSDDDRGLLPSLVEEEATSLRNSGGVADPAVVSNLSLRNGQRAAEGGAVRRPPLSRQATAQAEPVTLPSLPLSPASPQLRASSGYVGTPHTKAAKRGRGGRLPLPFTAKVLKQDPEDSKWAPSPVNEDDARLMAGLEAVVSLYPTTSTPERAAGLRSGEPSPILTTTPVPSPTSRRRSMLSNTSTELPLSATIPPFQPLSAFSFDSVTGRMHENGGNADNNDKNDNDDSFDWSAAGEDHDVCAARPGHDDTPDRRPTPKSGRSSRHANRRAGSWDNHAYFDQLDKADKADKTDVGGSASVLAQRQVQLAALHEEVSEENQLLGLLDTLNPRQQRPHARSKTSSPGATDEMVLVGCVVCFM